MAVPAPYLKAIFKYAHLVEPLAEQHGINGRQLLARLAQGESHFNMGAVSSAGARGATQFMPATRADYIKRFHIDPWASPDQAIHATAIYLRNAHSIGAYNPGMASYTGYILGQHVGNLAKQFRQAGGNPTTQGTYTSAPGTTPNPIQQGDSGLASLIAELQDRPGRPQGSITQAPQYTSSKYFNQIQPGMPKPQAQSSLSDLLASMDTGQQQTATAPRTVGSTGVQGVTRASGGGKVIISPTANRAGVGIQKPVLTFLHELSATSGRPVSVGTGTNHNQYVIGTHNESDHWTGNAADLPQPVDSKQGDLVAAHAIELASGMSFKKAYALAQQGGVWNFETKLGRVQILWKTNVGGNHHNHVHIGVNPNR